MNNRTAVDMQPTPPAWPDKPWVTIWLYPRRTIRAILDSPQPQRFVYLLSALGGIEGFLNRASRQSAGDSTSLWSILAMAIVLGALGGIVQLYVTAGLAGWVGRQLGGEASGEEVRPAFAWANVPSIANFVFLIPLIAFYGNEMFSEITPKIDSNPIPLLFSVAPGIILGVWGLVILVVGVSEAHRFSIWRAIVSLLIPGLILLIVLGGCALLYVGFN